MKVGDYVRTNDGDIGKIIKCPFKSMYLDEIWGDIGDFETIITNNVYKSSPNIIDLIEVGDYVNGSKVIDISIIGKDKEKWVWVEQMEDTNNKYGDDYVGYNNDQIKSIVTHEQFSQIEYKVGE